LGFTHACGTHTQTGKFTVLRKTIGKRMAAKAESNQGGTAQTDARAYQDTGDWLRAVVRGYFNYFAVPGNFPRFAVVSARCDSQLVASGAAEGATSLRRTVFDRIVAQHLPAPRFCILIHWSGFAPHIRDKNRVALMSARTGPCGGCRATGIPTATPLPACGRFFHGFSESGLPNWQRYFVTGP